jgi:thiol-disulfide isomerase/thioredoxin
LKTVLIWPLFLSVLVFSCSTSEEQVENESLNQIVLIIDQCPEQSRVVNSKTGNSIHLEEGFEIIYRDTNLITHTYVTYAEKPNRDTLIFPVYDRQVEIGHRYKVHKMLSYLFKKGDTILFTYEEGFPNAKVLNRDTNPIEVNYKKIRHDFLLQKRGGYLVKEEGIYDASAYYKRLDIMPIVARYRPDKTKIDQEIFELKKDKFETVTKEKEWEAELLDSLYHHEMLSNEALNFYRTKSEVDLAFAEFDLRKYEEEQLIVNEHEKATWPIQGDSLIHYGYYSDILQHVDRMTYWDQVPRVVNISRKIPDYRVWYDSIRNANWLSDREKKALLTKKMELIFETRTKEEIGTYFEKYKEDVKNGKLIEHVVRTNRYELPSEIVAQYVYDTLQFTGEELYKLHLLSSEGEKVEFSTVLKNHRGKLVYVDFWASSCLPCIMAIPYSKELSKLYETEQLSIIYVSLDKEKAEWKKAAEKLDIKEYPHNYIVDASSNGNFLEQFNVRAIPRYMFFDQNGELIQSSAPGPGTVEVLKIINRFTNN